MSLLAFKLSSARVSVREIGCIDLSKLAGCARTIRTKAANRSQNQVVKWKCVTSRKRTRRLAISCTNVQGMRRCDLRLRSYTVLKEPLVTDEHREKRTKFLKWIGTNFHKESIMGFLYFDEKMFDIDVTYNTRNDRIWVVDHKDANDKSGVGRRRKFPRELAVWLAVFSKGVWTLVTFENGTVGYDRYIMEVLLVALKYVNRMFRND